MASRTRKVDAGSMRMPTWGIHSSCINAFGFKFCSRELLKHGIAKLTTWEQGAVYDVVVIGPNTSRPEGIDAQQLTVSSSFIIEVFKVRLSGKIPSTESFLFVEPVISEQSSLDPVVSASMVMTSPSPAKKSRTEEVRNPPGQLDAGAGNLSNFT